jgi:succinyl-CoA synthetase alpha subunit
MSILLDHSARAVVQGIAGNVGKFSSRDMLAYGTRIVGGTAHGRADKAVDRLPVFPNVAIAVRDAGANASVVYVPATSALDHVIEAAEAGVKLIVYPGDGLPVIDAIEMRAAARANGAVLVGPNTPGLISPSVAKLGFMPSFCYMKGSLGVISRSGSLSYESCHRLTETGLGQTTVVGIGGDPIKGVTAAEALALFHNDPETRAIVFLGEIGGSEEYAVAQYASRKDAKPVAALIVGRQAPPGKKMGHAAALVQSHAEGHAAKCDALEKCGVFVARSLTDLVRCAHAAVDAADRKRR